MRTRSTRHLGSLFLQFGIFAPAFLLGGGDDLTVKARAARHMGTLFLVLAMIALVLRIFGGDELSLIPWPVALIVIAIGVFLLKQGGRDIAVRAREAKNPHA